MDRTVQVWRIEAPSAQLVRLHMFRGHSGAVTALAFSPDGRLLASGGKAHVRLWNVLDPPDSRILPVQPGRPVVRLAYRPDGKLLASSSLVPSIQLWSPIAGTLERTLPPPEEAPLTDLVFHSSRLVTATGSVTDTWDTQTGKKWFSLFPMNGGHGLAVTPDGRYLAGSRHRAVLVWDRAAIEKAQAQGASSAPPAKVTLPVEPNVFSLAFSPDGAWLATSTGLEPTSSTVRIWDVESGKVTRCLPLHRGMPADVAFSPDGVFLATSDGNEAKLWDRVSGELRRVLRGHAGFVWGVAFSPDGRRLATASADQTAKLWEMSDGQEVLTLSGHRGTVYRALFRPDGRQIATCSADGTVRLWDTELLSSPR
jgi:WD40 repeat protein